MNIQATCCESNVQPSLSFPYRLLCQAAICIFIASACVPTLSTQKKETDQSTSALIKPTLQDRSTEYVAKAPDQSSGHPVSRLTPQEEGSAEPGLWRRVFGIVESRKSSKSPPEPVGLVKPVLSDQPVSRENDPADSVEKKPIQTSNIQPSDTPGSEQVEKAPRTRQSKSTEELKSAKGFREFDRPVGEDSEVPLDLNREKKGHHELSDTVNGEQDAKPPADPVEKPDPFPKHDHSKYTTSIRHKAIDMLNRETDCEIARLCKDSLTDEWTLVLYFKIGASYYYVMYSWDEIEGKWSQSFVSERSPLPGIKKHLAFSAAGKSCKVLKGSDGVD